MEQKKMIVFQNDKLMWGNINGNYVTPADAKEGLAGLFFLEKGYTGNNTKAVDVLTNKTYYIDPETKSKFVKHAMLAQSIYEDSVGETFYPFYNQRINSDVAIDEFSTVKELVRQSHELGGYLNRMQVEKLVDLQKKFITLLTQESPKFARKIGKLNSLCKEKLQKIKTVHDEEENKLKSAYYAEQYKLNQKHLKAKSKLENSYEEKKSKITQDFSSAIDEFVK